jgi:hypothetical protein
VRSRRARRDELQKQSDLEAFTQNVEVRERAAGAPSSKRAAHPLDGTLEWDSEWHVHPAERSSAAAADPPDAGARAGSASGRARRAARRTRSEPSGLFDSGQRDQRLRVAVGAMRAHPRAITRL